MWQSRRTYPEWDTTSCSETTVQDAEDGECKLAGLRREGHQRAGGLVGGSPG